VDVLRDPLHNGESVAQRHPIGGPHFPNQHRHVLLHGAQGNWRICELEDRRVHCCQSNSGFKLYMKKTKEFVNISIMAIVSINFFYIFLGAFIKPIFVSTFTTNEQMSIFFSFCYDIYLYVFYIFDCYQCVFGSILRSLGE
jgi:hypothetical protein